MFIVFDGPDGFGKTTQAALLAEKCTELGGDVLLVQDPGHTRLGKELRRLLKDPSYEMRPITQSLLFAAARAETSRVIAAHLDRGGIAIADRWLFSTYVYQGLVLGVPSELLKYVADEANCGLTPDLVITLDMDCDAAMRRKGGPDNDRFESKGIEFQQKLREAYVSLTLATPYAKLLDVADTDRYAVHEAVCRECSRRIPAFAELVTATQAR